MQDKQHSPRFDTVRKWYQKGLWTAPMVEKAVGKWITETEKVEILKENE